MTLGSSQKAQGEDGSTNLAAGRDVIYNGASRDEIKEIALGVFRDNFLDLRGVAEEIALGRAERVTNDYLNRLMEENPQKLGALVDPDMQRAVFTAQQEYACSGEEELARTLVDLLVERTGQEDRSLKTLALNEAITAAPKLTSAQRRAIAATFILKYTRYSGSMEVAGFHAGFVRHNLLGIARDGLPTRMVEYQHIEYVGAGTVTMGEVTLGRAFKSGNEGLFTPGFEAEAVPADIRDAVLAVAIPAIRDPAKLQLPIRSTEELDGLASRTNLTKRRDSLLELLERHQMTDEQVLAEAVAETPELQVVIDAWSASSLKNLTLTSVGLAIGHAYWQRSTGGRADLSIWL